MEKSVVGELVGRRGIVYAPTNRAGVLLIFGRLLDEFDLLIEEIASDCSRVVARRRHDNGPPGDNLWEKTVIAIAYKSGDLKEAWQQNAEGQSPDFLICWQNNWPECPCEVFELNSLFGSSEAQPAAVQKGKIENLIPDDASLILKTRAQMQSRFEKAIKELDNRLGKLKGN